MLNNIWSKYSNRSPFLLTATLKGFAQVMFQNNSLTGCFFLSAIAVSAYQAGMIQIAIGSIVATLTATVLGLFIAEESKEFADGLYGYNACLVGITLPTILVNSPALWGLIILGSILSVLLKVLITYTLKQWKLAAFTAPFVFATWAMLIISHLYGHFQYIHFHLPPTGTNIIYLFNATLHGVSQVFLCDNLIAGALILIGLSIASKRATVVAFLSSLIAISVAFIQQDNPQQVAAGLYGFSAVLTGLAFHSLPHKKEWKTVVYTTIAILLTALLQNLFNQELKQFDLPALTTPFVSICWIFLLLKQIHFPHKTGS